jgi:hypothetical protein
VQIASVRGGEEGMALRVMQEQQRPATQDLARAPDQAAGDQAVGVNGFLVSIQVQGRWWVTVRLRLHGPQRSRPGRQRVSEPLITPGMCHLGEKAFAVAVAIGSSPAGQERQGVAGVAPQIPTASQPHRAEEEQGYEGLATCRRGRVRQPSGCLFASREILLQGRNHPRLVGSGEQEQTPSSLVPGRLKGRPVRLIFPPRPTPGV